jgi:sortase A
MPNILEWNPAALNIPGGSRPELTKPGIHSYNSRRRTDSSVENIPIRSPFPWIRALSLFVGLACIGYYAFTLADDFVYQRYQNWAFDQHMVGRHASFSSWLMGTTPLSGSTGAEESTTATPSESHEGVESRSTPSIGVVAYGSTIGRVVVPRLGLRSIVREGADENTLRRAVGHVPSTQMPGEVGNSAIAAHRDTLFRALKDIKLGDRVSFESPQGTFDYRVISTKIVKPSDVSVLEPQGNQKLLTMITCYPFYYVGSAPKRFIVTAQLDSSDLVSSKRTESAAAPSPTQVPAGGLTTTPSPAPVAAREPATRYTGQQKASASRVRPYGSSRMAARRRQSSALRQTHGKPGFWHKLNPFKARQAS